MDDARRTAPSAGTRLTRRALLEGAGALGLAAVGSHAWPVDASPRASARQGPGHSDWGAFDRAVETATQRFGIVGAAVAVVNAAGLVYQRTFGVRDLATGAPVTPGTLFRVASTTKSMSALLVARFVDEGLLGWDQPVREVWPAFRAPTDELTAALRVRDLLGMATGLGAWPMTDLQQGYPTPRQLLESVTWLPVLGPPHSQFFYNNTVYAVGGYLPALALGAEPDELLAVHTRLMQERVFGPVGMATARKADDPRPFSDDYATGYAPDVSVQARLQTPERRACPASGDALQPRHDRDAAAAGARRGGAGVGSCFRAAPGAGGDAPTGERCAARAECSPAGPHPR